MPRAKNNVASKARKKKVLKQAKGSFGRRKNVWTVAKNSVEKGLTYAYIGRKLKKRQFRSLWIQRINAAAREHGMSYSQFMHGVNQKGIELDRKALAEIAFSDPDGFKAIVDSIKG
jgi:large subunit ribosomal protein L20